MIMSEIEENEKITQRELSRKLDVSVSTINVLINKMIKEGSIKMTQVSQRQVLYMLTPAGMMEKAKKTVNYLKIHYRAIFQTKERIKEVLNELSENYDIIYILTNQDEIDEIIRVALEEINENKIEARLVSIDEIEKIKQDNCEEPILIYTMDDEMLLSKFSEIPKLKLMNLSEQLQLKV